MMEDLRLSLYLPKAAMIAFGTHFFGITSNDYLEKQAYASSQLLLGTVPLFSMSVLPVFLPFSYIVSYPLCTILCAIRIAALYHFYWKKIWNIK